MDRDPTSFDDRTDAAIEALVDMYLSRPVRVDADSPAQEPAETPPQEQHAPYPTPIPIDTPRRAMAPAHVEAVLIGHLPGLANPWLSQYADSRSRPDQPVAVCHLFADQVEIELVHRDPTAPHEGPESGPDLQAALDDLAERAGLWLVRVGQADTTIARSACAAIGTWTLLSGADEAAVVAAYKLIKQSRLPLDSEEPAHRRVQVMLAGCRDEQAEHAADKITHAVRSFLELPAHWIGTRPRMQPVSKQRIGIFRNPPRANAEPAWASLLRFLTERLGQPVESSTEPTPTEIDPPPTLRLHTDEPDDEPVVPSLSITHDEPDEPEPPEPPESPESPEPEEPAQWTEEDAPADPHGKSLIDYVEDLKALPVRCPLDERVELAVDARGGMHLLHHADGITVHQGLAALVGARAWVEQHAALIHQACDGRELNTANLTLHLFTDTPKPVLPFCLAGAAGRPALRLHLLQTVRAGDQSHIAHTPLN